MKDNNALLPRKYEVKKKRELRDYRKAQISMILDDGPYDHFATFTTAVNCTQPQAWKSMEFLLHLIDIDLFGRKYQNKPDSEQKSLTGYVFAETQGYGNLHFHFIINSNPRITDEFDLELSILRCLSKPKYPVKCPRIYPRYMHEINDQELISYKDALEAGIVKELRKPDNGVYRSVFKWQGFDLQPIYDDTELCDYLTKTLRYQGKPKEITTSIDPDKKDSNTDSQLSPEKDTKTGNGNKPAHEKTLRLPAINADFICKFNKSGINNRPVYNLK